MRTCGFVCAEKINSWSHCRGLSVCLCSIYPVILLYTAGSKKKKKEVSLSSRFLSGICSTLVRQTIRFFGHETVEEKLRILYSETIYIYHTLHCGCRRLKYRETVDFSERFLWRDGATSSSSSKVLKKKKRKEKYFLHLHLTFFCVDTKHSLVSILIYCDT